MMPTLSAPRLWALLLLLLSWVAVSAQPLPAGVTRGTSVEGIDEYRLANGLQVLMVVDDSKPTTTVNLTVRVGSRHENYGETGMAHLLEHMLFKGSPTTRNPWAELSRRGLRANGTTSLDRTNYFASFAANDEHLQWYLSWLADAMVNSLIDPNDLATEMPVVRNEMEMGENNPGRVLLQQTMAAMYRWHNYGKSTIGARADVENVDIERLRDFYRRHYRPDNATLIVSGTFDKARTLAWIADGFGRIPKATAPLPAQHTIDPVQDGERSVTVRRVGGSPLLFAAYHVPPGAAADHAAVELLTLVLGDTPGGRLHKTLVEAGLASGSFGSAWALAEPSVAFFGAQLAPGQDPDRARQALLATVEGLAAQPVTDEELQRARNKWLNDWETGFSDPERVGVELSESVALGDWRLYFLNRDRVRATTLADVQRVARQYLLPANRTVGTYVPTERPERAPAPERVDVAAQLKDFVPQPAAPRVAAFDASPANIDARTERFTLPVGLQAALLPKPTRGGAVQVVLTLRHGDERSLAGWGDVPSMTAALLDKGAAGLDRQQIQDRLDALQSELSISGRAGVVNVTLRSRREHVAAAVELVARLLRTPTFPEAALDEARRQRLASVQSQRDNPESIVGNQLARHGNPYPRGDVRHARSFDEMAVDIRAADLQRIRDYHAGFYGASNAQFAAVGDFDPAALRRALEAAFGDWRSPKPYARVPQPMQAAAPVRLVTLTPDRQNAVLGVQLPVPLNDLSPDYAAFMVANFLLGGGGDSRLHKRIREREGLSYATYSYVDWSSFEENSLWAARTIHAPRDRERVEQVFAEEVDKALRDGFGADEVAAAKEALLSRRRLNRAQDDILASTLAGNLYLGRTMQVSQRVDEAIAALTPAQIDAALRRHLAPARFAQALAGDFRQP
jgi:zinc protease